VSQIDSASSNVWIEMTDEDLDQPVKAFQNKSIAFKFYMNISACVEGKGQGYLQ
jgi:hypothetical protein